MGTLLLGVAIWLGATVSVLAGVVVWHAYKGTLCFTKCGYPLKEA